MALRKRKNLVVYRLENKKGRGPYRPDGRSSGFSRSWRTDEHYVNTGRPTPMEDKLWPIMDKLTAKLKKNEQVLFGFATKRQLTKWFNRKELATLKKMGFTVQVYCPKVSYSTRHQAVFVR